MKIDYDLVEKIGATHYSKQSGSYYKLTDCELLFFNDSKEKYEPSKNSLFWVAKNLKPIPPKRTRTEYEKVTESIFNLRDEFERGELFMKGRGAGGDFFNKITTEYELVTFASRSLYRKVEKEIDWRDEVSSDFAIWFDDGYVGMKCQRFSEENFLEMCRVALRANGELD